MHFWRASAQAPLAAIVTSAPLQERGRMAGWVQLRVFELDGADLRGYVPHVFGAPWVREDELADHVGVHAHRPDPAFAGGRWCYIDEAPCDT